jgi:hypothetical protein
MDPQAAGDSARAYGAAPDFLPAHREVAVRMSCAERMSAQALFRFGFSGAGGGRAAFASRQASGTLFAGSKEMAC